MTKLRQCVAFLTLLLPLSSYSPYQFIRVGNRKPNAPNNPRTLEQWRELENKFSSGTIRDEITLTRFQLEYFSAENDQIASVSLNG